MSIWNQIHNEYGLLERFKSILEGNDLSLWQGLSRDEKIMFDWYKRHSA